MSGTAARPPSDHQSPLRAVIVDDEAPARRGLRHLLANEPDITVIAECAAGDEAVAAIENERPDLVFLDVQMPGLDGFGILRALKCEPWPMIVFVTAFDTYATDAFDAAAIDYLLKPVTAARFQSALARVRERLREREAARQLPALKALLAAQPPKPPPRLDRLLVRLGNRAELLPAAEIDWMEADGDYVNVHAGARSHFLSQSLTALLEQLDPNHFTRIHRAKAVNLARVRSLQRLPHGEYVLTLANGRQLTAGRTYTESLKRLFKPA
ncbi:MAG: LytTR family DNA-binding domain-containing protein [Nibricoccus sp.]